MAGTISESHRPPTTFRLRARARLVSHRLHFRRRFMQHGAACWTCSRETSRCVTARMRCGAVAFIQHAFVAEPRAERGGRAELGVDFEDHDVRVDDLRIELQAGRCADRFGEDAGVGVVFGQAVDVVLERVERAGGDDAGLPHAAAERFAMAAGLADQIGRAAEGGADRRTEAFGEADADGVEVAGPIGGRNAGGDDGVEQAGAVEVAGQAVVGGPAADFGDGVVRLDAAGAAVVRVLQADEPRADAVVVRRPDAAHQLLDVQHAVVAFDRLRGDAEELGVRALLVAEMWQLASHRNSSPAWQWTRTPSWLPIVPEGTKSAASLPSMPAMRSSSWRTVGSSPKTSSPTSAAAMAARIAGVGRVTVSLRRSIGSCISGFLFDVSGENGERRCIIAFYRRADNPVRS